MALDPFLGVNPIIQGLEQRRGYIEQLRQNTSRLAQSFNFVETAGAGGQRLPAVVHFACTFIEKPVVATGFTVESDMGADFPLVTAGVWRWQTDKRGYYIGCWVFVRVESATDLVIQHDFTFTGIAMKDLPAHLLDL